MRITLITLLTLCVTQTFAQKEAEWPDWFMQVERSIEESDLGMFMQGAELGQLHRDVISSELKDNDSLAADADMDKLLADEITLLDKENRYRFIALMEEFNFNQLLGSDLKRDSMTMKEVKTIGKVAVTDYTFYLSLGKSRLELGMTSIKYKKEEYLFQWNTTAYVPRKEMPTLCFCFDTLSKIRNSTYELSGEELTKAETELKAMEDRCKDYLVLYSRDELEKMLESCGIEP